MKKARENDDYLLKIYNCLRAGNQNQVFLLSDNFIAFEYNKQSRGFGLEAFAYGLSKKKIKKQFLNALQCQDLLILKTLE